MRVRFIDIDGIRTRYLYEGSKGLFFGPDDLPGAPEVVVGGTARRLMEGWVRVPASVLE